MTRTQKRKFTLALNSFLRAHREVVIAEDRYGTDHVVLRLVMAKRDKALRVLRLVMAKRDKALRSTRKHLYRVVEELIGGK